MKKADWNEYLSIKNPWVKRLLGIEPFSKIRDLNQIQREYDQDKYGSLLNLNFSDVNQYKEHEYHQVGLNFLSTMVFSLEEEVFEARVEIVRSLYYSLVANIIHRYQPRRICELGCGYGINFPHLGQLSEEVYGGEFSQSAVQIAQCLNFDIQMFNYYDLNNYGFIRKQSLIFTSHSVEQLPDAQCFISGLKKYQENIDVVVNFEPTFLSDRHTLIGTLRNRYVELNDYNRNLVDLLHSRDDIEILEFYPDSIGMNPLNPACVIVWKFQP